MPERKLHRSYGSTDTNIATATNIATPRGTTAADLPPGIYRVRRCLQKPERRKGQLRSLRPGLPRGESSLL